MICPQCQIAYHPDHWGTCPHCGDREEMFEETERSGTELSSTELSSTELSGVLQTSTILIAAGDGGSQVYRSFEEVPERLRRTLTSSTNGLNSGTIYIADQRGRERIERALRALPDRTEGPVIGRLSKAISGSVLPQQQTARRRPSRSGLWLALTAFVLAGAVAWIAGNRPW